MITKFVTWHDARRVRPMPLLRALPLILTSAMVIFFIVDTPTPATELSVNCMAHEPTIRSSLRGDHHVLAHSNDAVCGMADSPSRGARRTVTSQTREAAMIIESGVIIFIGLLLLFIKLPRRIALRLFGYPLALDIAVAILAYALHWGTFSGVMAAAVAGLMASGFTMAGRYFFGHIRGGVYYSGVFPLRT